MTTRASRRATAAALVVMMFGVASAVRAQVPPSPAESKAYRGLFAAVAAGDRPLATRLIARGADVNARDSNKRTPLHVAAHRRDPRMIRLLASKGANANALDAQRYDIVTIAAVNDDVATLEESLRVGSRATTVTSPYQGTALIAASHLGNVAAVQMLLAHGAPFDHVNNLGWTALLEAVILGDGGSRHQQVVRRLLAAGADATIADRNGVTPEQHARQRGYTAMLALFDAAR